MSSQVFFNLFGTSILLDAPDLIENPRNKIALFLEADAIEWIHSDPVSGSSQRTNKNGSPNERKEYEPLGNQIVNTNGDENDYPPPATQVEEAGMKNSIPITYSISINKIEN